MNERRNDLEIMNWAPQIALQTQNSDQSPLYDVRNPARASHKDATCEVMFRGRYVQGLLFKASIFNLIWWSQTGSNRRPHACKARALPAELWPRTRRRMPFALATAQRPSFKKGLPSRSCRAAKAGGPG